MKRQATHVLLIEDNPGDADLVRLRLVEGEQSVRLSCVSRLEDGLAVLSNETPSLVLLDLNLPDCHGAETYRRLIEHSPNTPVVVLSGLNDEVLAVKAVHHGVQDYLVKGNFTSEHLGHAIQFAVERQALLRSLELAQKKQLEFKDQFLSHVSHELRTPLTCIHQYVTLLLDGLAGRLAPDQVDHLKTVLKSVNQLHAMIRDLLEATRAESGKMAIDPRCVTIGDLVRQTVAMMRPAADEKKIALKIELDGNLPLVHADPDRVLEVLINLVDNAIKFTPQEGTVTVKGCRVEADPGYVYISVTDTGRGVSVEAKTLIFQRMYQDPDSVDDHRSGLGLGLFISKEIVGLHQGRIWVSSEAGLGSTFTFTLPTYSLAKLLGPVVIYQDRLRPAFVLVSVQLTPLAKIQTGSWKETRRQCLETLRLCVHFDKDLVLPPVEAAGTTNTFFIVASTDLNESGVMTTRIREQLEHVLDLKAKCRLTIVTTQINLPSTGTEQNLQQHVQAMADQVTGMILTTTERDKFGGGRRPPISN